MTRYIFSFLFFVVLLLSVCSCGIIRKKTVTKTETIIQVDTIIKVKFDTVRIIKEAFLTDTVLIENKTSIARSYFNPISRKIVLELKGKIFDVPVTIDVHKVETKKEVETKQKFPFIYIFLLILIPLCLFIYLIIRKK